ncbi:hypothetical protein GCM10017786_74640 [Amycolatopsis deserti]|uniref:Abortive infection protein n=1 Tax=Amycolatopsis deserti TaxID=185696 RepID=A0ABQ3JG91_9PSEU|nr:hypothetical protein [Amycolatopsis deserti]GHF29716.1 hypothetical protein GCM10017786_74640 [Amycolatopsis deserti]
MRRRGINYDIGVSPLGTTSRRDWDLTEVRREMRMIAEDLHCSAVRVTGDIPGRIEEAAAIAADSGLEVWFSPFPCELPRPQLLTMLADAAVRAERLRGTGAEVVFVAGGEISLFNRGFFAGDDLRTRMSSLVPAAGPAEFADFLGQAAAAVRARFGGPVTYAAGSWEPVDWAHFDIVSVDAYRSADNARTFREELRTYTAHGKPVVATEFGCCTFRGAADRGATGWTIADRATGRLAPGYERDEDEQARYFTELLADFEAEGLDGAFWFTFAGYGLPHRADPARDLDLASYGVVKLTDAGLRPKAVFHAMAQAYSASHTAM